MKETIVKMVDCGLISFAQVSMPHCRCKCITAKYFHPLKNRSWIIPSSHARVDVIVNRIWRFPFPFRIAISRSCLGDHGAGSGALILPVGLKNTNSFVVSAETVDSRFDENKSEFRVLVFSVAFEVLADSDGLRWSAMCHFF